MKLRDLLENLTIGQRYAKHRVLSDIADVLGVYLGMSESSLEKIARNDPKVHLSLETKALLLGNWNNREKEVLDYLEQRITNEQAFASLVGVVQSNEYKKRLLCKAVREQLRLFFDLDGTEAEVNNIIPSVYTQLLENPDAAPTPHTPLYAGDDAYDFSKTKDYTIDIYGSVVHEFELQNRGMNIWVNRRLVYIDDNNHVRPTPLIVDIPETGRNGLFKVFIEVLGRGAEGVATLRWKMVDNDGSDCFPTEPDKFRFTVATKFNPLK